MQILRRISIRTVAFSLSLALSGAGCSLFFGTIKVDERSDRYHVMDLSRENSGQWSKIERESGDNAANSSDFTYQAKDTGGIMSANSSCRGAQENTELSDKTKLTAALRAQAKLLMLGIASVQPKTQKEITVAGQPALESTIEGKMGTQKIRMRSVVLRKERCQYDLLYIASPDQFAANEALFSEFVASLQIH